MQRRWWRAADHVLPVASSQLLPAAAAVAGAGAAAEQPLGGGPWSTSAG